jgi:hypothetical protein
MVWVLLILQTKATDPQGPLLPRCILHWQFRSNFEFSLKQTSLTNKCFTFGLFQTVDVCQKHGQGLRSATCRLRFWQVNPTKPDQSPPFAARAPEVFSAGQRSAINSVLAVLPTIDLVGAALFWGLGKW